MGDVVGALPSYSQKAGMEASVIIPKYDLKWFRENKFSKEFEGSYWVDGMEVKFSIQKAKGDPLGYPFYCVDMPGLFDRPSIYLDTDGEGFTDEPARNFGFQRAVLLWLNQLKKQFDLLHCHDHQSGLIPFFTMRGPEFANLRDLPNFYTIHNAAYHGKWLWENMKYLPVFYGQDGGLLEWDNQIHSLAAALKSCWGFNAVSPTYLEEIAVSSGNLNWLFHNEKEKGTGIINGIDNEVWNPKSDKFLAAHYKTSWTSFKQKNKKALLAESELSTTLPLFSFIGRFAYQKGGDILCDAIRKLLKEGKKANFLILGTGSKELENAVTKLQQDFPKNVLAHVMYNEELAHQIYAGSDFLLMPSRFEPCGLNQMFAMRYATLPVVHSTGGLIDTVTDIDDDGTGIRFDKPTPDFLAKAIERGIDLYKNKKKLKNLRAAAAGIDFSWTRSVLEYKKQYLKLIET